MVNLWCDCILNFFGLTNIEIASVRSQVPRTSGFSKKIKFRKKTTKQNEKLNKKRNGSPALHAHTPHTVRDAISQRQTGFRTSGGGDCSHIHISE